jgi:hypothetical protein
MRKKLRFLVLSKHLERIAKLAKMNWIIAWTTNLYIGPNTWLDMTQFKFKTET